MPRTAIILVNYKGAEHCLRCLESLKTLQSEFSVFITDNASADDSLQKLYAWQQQHRHNLAFDLHIIESEQNVGFGAGNNLAIRAARSVAEQMGKPYTHFWILNNDTIVEPNSLSLMITELEKNKGAGICGNCLKYTDGVEFSDKIQAYGGCINLQTGTTRYIRTKSELHLINYIVGASMLVTVECMDALEGLPEDYFLYYEETDFCFTALKNGFSLCVATEAVVYHNVGAVTGSEGAPGSINSFTDCLIVANRIRFARKHLQKGIASSVSIYTGLLISMVNRILRRQPKRIWIIFKLLTSKRYFARYCGLNQE